MADDVQVTCITKRDRPGPHERIQAIGGKNPSGQNWRLPEADAIAGMKSGKWTFFTQVSGKRANVRIGKHLGREYLTTVADGVLDNNLLSLNNCPL